ncbi:MAG TPA: lysophospholipid acyltransferase family protein [Bdellovibrionales bacterium]|nr:lysophospholipid acyltransferase family protein [Bdellovibrionales bacterium]
MKYLITLPRAVIIPWFLALYTILCSAWFVIVSILTGRRDLETKIIQTWGKGLCWLAGVKLRVKGLEKIPPGGVLYVFNHQSHMDIPIIHAAIPRDFRFGAKTELFKIPVFAWAMRRAGALEIPRAQRSQALRVLADAERRIQGGESFVLAPEGTRQSRPELGEFRSGPFVVALKAQAPLVPVVLRGANRVLPKGSIFLNWRTYYNPVDVEILDPVPTKGLQYESRDQLKSDVRSRMREAFDSGPRV